MLEQITLRRDLTDSEGRILALRGALIGPDEVARAAAAAAPGPLRPLSESGVARDAREPFGDPGFKHLFRQEKAQHDTLRILLSAPLPEAAHAEIEALRDRDWPRYRHGVATAALTVRMLLFAVGESKALPDLAAAALLHDLGMGHMGFDVYRSGSPLTEVEIQEIAAHPLLGAFHLATILGRHPAVDAALAHHWRRGQGYPVLRTPPPRSVEVVAVASAYVAMIQPRTFRSTPFDARGAADVLIAEAQAGEADMEAVQLLVQALRGAAGDRRAMQFGRQRLGHAPANNQYTPVARALAG